MLITTFKSDRFLFQKIAKTDQEIISQLYISGFIVLLYFVICGKRIGILSVFIMLA